MQTIDCVCSKCGESYSKSRRRGSFDQCPKCLSNARVAAWNARNPEQRDFYLNHTAAAIARKGRYAKSERGRRKIRENVKRYRLRHPEKVKAYQDRRNLEITLGSLGITKANYDRMLAMQGGVCKICKNSPGKRRLDIDHCHQTGLVRGLICHKCNRAIGWFNEDIARMVNAIHYLVDASHP